jgi:hypothetical protein
MAHLYGPRVMHGVKTPEEYAADHFAKIAAIRDRFGDQRQVHPADVATVAFVNEGRWVVNCPECFSGAAVDVDEGVARCYECGAVYATATETLVLPSPQTIAAIDEALGARGDRRAMNWTGETTAALRRENKQHGAVAGKGRL